MKQGLSIFLGITASSTIFTLFFFKNLDNRIITIQKIISEEREKTIQYFEIQKNDIKQIIIKQREETLKEITKLIKDEKKKLLFDAHSITSELKPSKIWKQLLEKVNNQKTNML